MPLGSIRAPPRGRHGKNIKKSSPKPLGPKLSYFVLAMYSGPLYKSYQLCPWGPYGPRPGGRPGKNIKKSSSPNHLAQSFHMLCGPMYNTLLYNCCQRCPWGPYRPCPRHVIILHRLIMEIYEKIFSATA